MYTTICFPMTLFLLTSIKVKNKNTVIKIGSYKNSPQG